MLFCLKSDGAAGENVVEEEEEEEEDGDCCEFPVSAVQKENQESGIE